MIVTMIRNTVMKGLSLLLVAAALGACTQAAATQQPKAAPVAEPSEAPPPLDSDALVSPLASPLGASRGSDTGVEIKVAQIDSVELVISPSEPSLVVAKVVGLLGDSCTTLGDTEQDVQDRKILIKVVTNRPAGRMCSAVVKDFSTEIPLEIDGLTSGDYIVDVNGMTRGLRIGDNGAPAIP
jgi:hypothetical protein